MLILHTQHGERVHVVDVDPTTRLADLDLVTPSDQLWSDDDQELRSDLTVAEVGKGRRLFCGPISTVLVFVRFNGETVSSEFRPGAPLARVLRRALAEPEFGLCDPHPGDFELRLCRRDLTPDLDEAVGSFVGDDLEVCFDLVPAEKFQG